MSVKGTLESLGLEELLQADLALQGEGRLILRNGAHYAALHMTSEGAYVVHPDLLDAELILRRLVDRGLIDAGVMARTRRHHLSDVLLLDSLVESGDLPEAELMEILAGEAEDTILDLMLWEEGHFLFERGRVDPAERGLLGRICVDPTGICARALSRIEERRAIGDLLGDSALLFVAITGELPALEDENDISHAVYARLNGLAVAHEIALELSAGRFEVLRAVTGLVRAGLARPATPEELVQQATLRADAGQSPVARALVLQWAQVHPTLEGPLRKLVSLAAACRDKQAELEALCALGHQQLQHGKSEEALETFTRAMRKAPADDVVIAGLKLAAEATGDNDILVDGTLVLAQTKIDEGEAQAALDLVIPLLESYPDNMGLHLMHARSLVLLEKRSELLEQAEIVGQVLGRDGCNSEVDREAVEFFREAIESVAPDRGDLLERFRMLHDPRRARRRRMALTGALLLLACSAGVFFWPASAATLLEKASEAASAGDKEQASLYLVELTSRFPDSPEVRQAIVLQNRLFPPHDTLPRHMQAERDLQKRVAAMVPELKEALAHLPAEEARESVQQVLDLLENARSETSRARALKPLAAQVQDSADRLNEEAVARVKLLAQAAGMNKAFQRDERRLRDFLERADRQRDAVWIANLHASSKLLSDLAAGEEKGLLSLAVRDLARSTAALEKAAEFYDAHAGPCRITLAGLEIEEADRACREEAPKLMVGGRIDQADDLYARLQALLKRYEEMPAYQELIDKLKRRQIPTFIRDKREQIADIRMRLVAARKAEQQDKLEEAVRIYAGLVSQYWLIRFETVFEFPLRVESLPAGAEVFVNDELVGRTPTVVRYAWGSEAAIRVESSGWASQTRVLRTAEETPSHLLHVSLVPAPAWLSTLPGTGALSVMALGRDVLRTDRGGRIMLHDGSTGAEKWSMRTGSLEGVRGRPANAGRFLYIPQVNGEVLLLDPATGTIKAKINATRPVGDMASEGDLAALTTVDGSLIAFRGRREAWRKPLGATPTAGVIGAHGAFWVGTAGGTVVRVGAADARSRTLRVAGTNVPVSSLVATQSGMLLTTANGSLIVLSAEGTVRWRLDELGDLAGSPALSGKLVAIVNRGGTLSLLNAEDGSAVRTFEVGKGAAHGVLGGAGIFFAARRDGHAWAYDVEADRVVLDAPMGLHALCTPKLLDNERMVVCLQNGRLALIPLPRLP